MPSDDAGPGDVIIIGASGGIGRDLRHNFSALGIPAIGLDKAGGPGVIAEDVLALSPKAIELISNVELVVLAVTDQLAMRAAPLLLPHLRPNATLMDCSSVKSGYQDAVAGMSHCAKVSINPLFGPGLKWSGRTMAVTRITDGPAVERWLGAFRRMGLTLIMLDAETHDRFAAEAQSAAHAAIIALFLSVGNDSAQFATPPYKLLKLLFARMLSAEAHVYWSIQAGNPFAKAARARLRDALDRVEHLIEANDASGFEAIWDERREMLGANLERLEKQSRQVIEFIKRLEHQDE